MIVIQVTTFAYVGYKLNYKHRCALKNKTACLPPGVPALKPKMSQLRYFKASIKEKIWGFIFWECGASCRWTPLVKLFHFSSSLFVHFLNSVVRYIRNKANPVCNIVCRPCNTFRKTCRKTLVTEVSTVWNLALGRILRLWINLLTLGWTEWTVDRLYCKEMWAYLLEQVNLLWQAVIM